MSGAKRNQAQEPRVRPKRAATARVNGVQRGFRPYKRLRIQTAPFHEASNQRELIGAPNGTRGNARKQIGHMNQTMGRDEDAAGSRNAHDLRLTALLCDLIEARGRRKSAAVLGVSYSALARAADTGRLSGRMRDALGRYLLERDGPQAIAELRTRLADLERRVAELKEVATGQIGDDVRSEDGEETPSRLGDEMESLTRRVEGVETRHGSSGPGPAAESSTPSTPGPLLERVVADEPDPDEETRFGAAAPLVAEWRRLRDEFDAAPDDLATLLAEWDLLELEIVMIGVCGLTLPPSDYPWDRFQLKAETRRRQRRMAEMREEIQREERRRRLRRICTLGLCKR